MKCKLRLMWLVLAIALLLTSIIPARIAIAFHQTPVPQAIFVLGSASERMRFAAQFWQSRQNLDIWVSDFHWNLDVDRRIFLKYGVPDAKLHLDGRATDTVTNFTTLAEDFAHQKLQHVYLITSDYHMRRARAIATIVLGSQGIVVTPVAVASENQPSESLVRVLRDCGRSFLWIFVSRTGSSLNPRLK
ncbi:MULTISPECIES: YdcF family protein [unclassified Nostoc]|uniref:YdcF family protein n=1 Tax=unclassified Nostoc TaxID=2593658 RepID=UPI002AD497B5|nr:MULTISPECIES: YdcF family protein [unclassified Nostoc]MDZ8125977.1 YdcF family protein [Nostoc sp. CmiVER01]MDZ8225843.1 YdcF family protein [Nostoc sp. ChiVER01]